MSDIRNFLFASGDRDPLKLTDDDRRFFVPTTECDDQGGYLVPPDFVGDIMRMIGRVTQLRSGDRLVRWEYWNNPRYDVQVVGVLGGVVTFKMASGEMSKMTCRRFKRMYTRQVLRGEPVEINNGLR